MTYLVTGGPEVLRQREAPGGEVVIAAANIAEELSPRGLHYPIRSRYYRPIGAHLEEGVKGGGGEVPARVQPDHTDPLTPDIDQSEAE